jgi:hypothetical protein
MAVEGNVHQRESAVIYQRGRVGERERGRR